MRPLRLAVRTLFRTPFVTTIAVVSLALGIGANAAIFSLFNQLLLRSLPVRAPEELVNLKAPGPLQGSTSCNQAGDCDEIFSYPLFRDLERGQAGMAGLAAHRTFGANIGVRKQTRSGTGVMVSGQYFATLGVQPFLGRLLGPADDETIGAHPVAVLSHRYWSTTLGADRTVLNEPVMINGGAMTIVGVAPPGFDGITMGEVPDLFVPISMRGQVSPGFAGFEDRRNHWVYLFGRPAPGVSVAQAATGLNRVFKPILADVEVPLQVGFSDATMAQFKAREIHLTSGRRGQSSFHKEAQTPLAMLFGVTGIVLLIACANIANLLLARGAGRATEVAVRMSLGAQRRQVAGQLLLEATVLALMAAAASLVVARWTLAAIGSMMTVEGAATLTFTLSWPMVAFAGGLALVTGLLFGLFPALHSTRPDLITAIRSSTGQASGARAASRFRTGLVTAQIALAMTLLTCAGLFIASLRNVNRVEVGADIDQMVTFRISPELNGYTGPRSAIFFRRLTEELRAVPGVTAVTSSLVPFLAGSSWGTSVSVEGFKDGPDVDSNARLNRVAAGYLGAMGMPLMAGREFTEADGAGGPRVAIVNETFARKFGLGRDAVGKRMATSTGNPELNIEIVGLVQDAKYSDVKDAVPPLFFQPHQQDTTMGELSFYVRTASDLSAVMRAIPDVVKSLDPDLPVEELKTVPQQVRETVLVDRIIGMLSSAFALLATLLAAIGLYGVLAYTVAQRTREIGVRMALGANARAVRAMVLRQVGVMTAIGGVIGLAAAVGLGRAARSLLFGLEGHDPVVLGASALLLTVVALGAGYLPARRASRVNPMTALRYE
ncbi:MAG: ABC transporter permease [Gemmatimonadetes bacterium]|nr:ABC transporter permease [Gemmatimonadota bacterium]